eukprot:6179843-Pleurochrysis_carterae.AAC.3
MASVPHSATALKHRLPQGTLDVVDMCTARTMRRDLCPYIFDANYVCVRDVCNTLNIEPCCAAHSDVSLCSDCSARACSVCTCDCKGFALMQALTQRHGRFRLTGRLLVVGRISVLAEIVSFIEVVPTASRSYLDIRASYREVELVNCSSYSAFALLALSAQAATNSLLLNNGTQHAASGAAVPSNAAAASAAATSFVQERVAALPRAGVSTCDRASDGLRAQREPCTHGRHQGGARKLPKKVRGALHGGARFAALAVDQPQ